MDFYLLFVHLSIVLLYYFLKICIKCTLFILNLRPRAWMGFIISCIFHILVINTNSDKDRPSCLWQGTIMSQSTKHDDGRRPKAINDLQDADDLSLSNMIWLVFKILFIKLKKVTKQLTILHGNKNVLLGSILLVNAFLILCCFQKKYISMGRYSTDALSINFFFCFVLFCFISFFSGVGGCIFSVLFKKKLIITLMIKTKIIKCICFVLEMRQRGRFAGFLRTR